jgi:hypothetical protein
MKVPPRKTAARRMLAGVSQSTLTATPIASTRAAAAKAFRIPQRKPSRAHSATEGAAARPTVTQMYGSSAAIWGESRTIATMKVAVMI